MSRSQKANTVSPGRPGQPNTDQAFAAGFYQAALRAFHAGRLDEARQNCRRALSLDQRHADALHMLALIEIGAGDKRAAENLIKKALAVREDADFLNMLANLQSESKRLPEAETSFRRALQIRPDHPIALNNLGNLLAETRRSAEAEVCYRRALELKPDYAKAHNNLGLLLEEADRLAEAETCLRQAVALVPNYVEAHYNLANTLMRQQRLDEAEAGFRRALGLLPNFADARFNLGKTLNDLGRLGEAEENFRWALNISPDHAEARSNLLLSLTYATQSPEIYQYEARRYGHMAAARAGKPYASWKCRDAPQRLRVGLVSGDFRRHPVSYFLEAVLANVNQAEIELFAYSTHRQADEVTERIKPRFAAWRPLFELDDEAAARLIHEDGVDILVDLSGHTAHNRLPVFAWKPAPVQVSWLGYAASTGVAEIDYLLADPYTVPETDDRQFTEKIWRLPETRLCFTAPESDVAVSGLPAAVNGYITFACFNNLTKMNADVVALWARVLAAVRGSRLLLKARQLQTAAIRQQVIERFASHGIGADRLMLEGYTPRADYLAAYHRVDVALDPFPFTGGTTSAEALWMGVPVLTLAGNSLVSRQGVGLLMNAGLPEWIAADPDDYVARAFDQTRDIRRLADLRKGLRGQFRVSPVLDAPRFARHLETALRDIWNAAHGVPA